MVPRIKYQHGQGTGQDRPRKIQASLHHLEDENNAHNDMEDEEQEDEIGDLRELNLSPTE